MEAQWGPMCTPMGILCASNGHLMEFNLDSNGNPMGTQWAPNGTNIEAQLASNGQPIGINLSYN